MNYNGIWLEIKGAHDYGKPRFIKFENDSRVYYTLSDTVGNPELVKEPYLAQVPVKIEVISDDRLRFFEKGRKTSFYNDRSSKSEEIVVQKDYQRLLPTETLLSDEEVAALNYTFTWKSKNINVVFNEIIDIPFIQEMNKRLGKEGSKFLLERFEDTLFLSFYSNGYRDNIFPIKAVNEDVIVVYGFPEESYEVTGSIIDKF